MDLEFYFIVLTASLSSLSLIANIWVTYVYFSFKELQRHPSTILSYISLFEISMSHHSIALILDSNLSIRGHGPHHMLQLITFFILDEQSARKISCAINQMFFSGAVAGVLQYIFISRFNDYPAQSADCRENPHEVLPPDCFCPGTSEYVV